MRAIMGIFDEGCMGMYNAIIPDELHFPLGVYKERLSQSALYARMRTVSDAEARAVYNWLSARGMKFKLGTDEATELTENQVLMQCKMYVAAVRIADEFGCATIGIQYQQGLKDLTSASDRVEGLLNTVERPPVYHEVTGEELYAGKALPHKANHIQVAYAPDKVNVRKAWYAKAAAMHELDVKVSLCGAI